MALEIVVAETQLESQNRDIVLTPKVLRHSKYEAA